MTKNYIEQQFAEIITTTFKSKLTKFIIALSGGVDSIVLAIIAHKWAIKNQAKIIAVTIDHGLRENSAQEALLVNKLMQKYQIEHEIIKWDRKQEINSNIEAKARKARYKLITEYAKRRKIETIMTAHHLDDQIENFFIRLSRGSGIDGLAAMAQFNKIEQNISLFRPFLTLKKAQLLAYATESQLTWFEDQTNQDRKYLRNNIRYILQQIAEPEILEQRIILATKHFSRAKDFLQKTTEQEYANMVQRQRNYHLINLDKFKKLHAEIALRILIKIFQERGGALYKPRFKKLEQLYQKIIANKINKSLSFSYCLLMVKDGQLLISKEKQTRS